MCWNFLMFRRAQQHYGMEIGMEISGIHDFTNGLDIYILDLSRFCEVHWQPGDAYHSEKTLVILALLNEMICECLRTRAPKVEGWKTVPTTRLSQTLFCGSNWVQLSRGITSPTSTQTHAVWAPVGGLPNAQRVWQDNDKFRVEERGWTSSST